MTLKEFLQREHLSDVEEAVLQVTGMSQNLEDYRLYHSCANFVLRCDVSRRKVQKAHESHHRQMHLLSKTN